MSTNVSAGKPEGANRLPHRRLPFWVALALSVALVGPTLAMSGNGQGLIGTVGKAIPLVFLIGLVGVSLAFAGVLAVLGSGAQAQAFLAGYAVEKSLSLDNVFVFLIVFNAFEIVQTLQGEAGNINSLLSHTASLTTTLADRARLWELVDAGFRLPAGSLAELPLEQAAEAHARIQSGGQLGHTLLTVESS